MTRVDDRSTRSLSQPKEVVAPFLTLLLARAPSHGYELVERLKAYGFDWGGPGPVYHHLGVLEGKEMVRADHFAAAPGPLRKVYRLTSAGRLALDGCAPGMELLRAAVGQVSAACTLVTIPAQASQPSSCRVGGATADSEPSSGLPDIAFGLQRSSKVTQGADTYSTDEGRRLRTPTDLPVEVSYPRGVVDAGILVSLLAGPAQSRQLIESLLHMGMNWDGPGPVYQDVHRLLQEGLIGPAPAAPDRRSKQRVYELTAIGRELLEAWSSGLEALHTKLVAWAQEYRELAQESGRPDVFR